jgi:hypothetical protein
MAESRSFLRGLGSIDAAHPGGARAAPQLEEIAEVLKVSTVTVKRDWRAARTWLYRELTGASTDAPRTMETS